MSRPEDPRLLGTGGDGASGGCRIGDYRHLVFHSEAGNLMPDDSNASRDVLLRNLATGRSNASASTATAPRRAATAAIRISMPADAKWCSNLPPHWRKARRATAASTSYEIESRRGFRAVLLRDEGRRLVTVPLAMEAAAFMAGDIRTLAA